MSTRALRKAQRDLEEQIALQKAAEEEEEEEEERPAKSSQKSLFAFLNEQDDDDDEEVDFEESEKENVKESKAITPPGRFINSRRDLGGGRKHSNEK